MTKRSFQLAAAAVEAVRPALDALRAELEVPGDFPPEALAEADRAAARTRSQAEDATDLELVTIDPPGSKDLDQALHLMRDGEGYVVHYAIADPASFVTPGGALDAALHERGTTFYGPDGRVSLHPKVLSEAAASLLPGQERPSCLWMIRLDAAGEIVDAGVRRARVRSREQLTYEQVQERVDGGTAGEMLALLPVIGTLRQEVERARGGVSLAIPEQEVEKTNGGYRLVYRSTLEVEEWNAQISMLTGIAAAQIMRKKRVGILRTLEPADPRDMKRLRRAAHGLGIEWPDGATYGDVIHGLDASEPAHAAFFNEATSLFRGANYLAFDGDLPPKSAHSAIAAEYAHVTAPLRRLVDRYGLEVCLAATAEEDVPEWVHEALPGLPKTMMRSSQRAGAYERECVDLIEAIVLSGREGESFTGVVVDLDEPRNGQQGKPGRPTGTVVLADPAVRARVEGDEIPLGERTQVRLVSAEPATRTVLFALS